MENMLILTFWAQKIILIVIYNILRATLFLNQAQDQEEPFYQRIETKNIKLDYQNLNWMNKNQF